MKSPLKLVVTWPVTLAVLATLTMSAITAHAETAKPDKLTCQKPVKMRGPGNMIQSVAELQTIIAWSRSVTIKSGDQWAQWHNAKAKRVKCLRTGSSQYFYCELSAIPCAAQQHVAAVEQAKSSKAPKAPATFIEDAPYIKKDAPPVIKKTSRNPRGRKP